MTAPAEAEGPVPRWIPLWLAALPPLYVVSLLAVLGLPQLKHLPRAVWWLLGFYALSQQLPALFSPEPFLASGLALVRTILIFACIGTGVALGQVTRLRWLMYGLGIVYVTALTYSLLGGADILISRLSHPYMTSITLGLAGAFGVWIVLFGPGKLLWRVPFGVLALTVLLLSGSRGSFAAAMAGAIAGFVVRRGWRLALSVVAGAALIAGGFYVGQRLEVSAITRLSSSDTTGRDVVWYNTLSVIRSEPWTGVGSYRLGARLESPDGACELFTSMQSENAECPEWVTKLGSPWLIAHNISLQQLAETGPVGLLGLFILLGAITAGALRGRQPMAAAVIAGLLSATIYDNTLLVPSPFFAEIFWVVAGTQLRHLTDLRSRTGALAALLMIVLSAPLLASALSAPKSGPISLVLLNAPTSVLQTQGYTAFVQFAAPPGKFRAVLQSCLESCSTVTSVPFNIEKKTSGVLQLKGNLHAAGQQRLQLLLYGGATGARIQPLAKRDWTVKVQP